jgi:hypothetical protein
MPLFQPMIPSATPTPNAVYSLSQALEISSAKHSFSRAIRGSIFIYAQIALRPILASAAS